LGSYGSGDTKLQTSFTTATPTRTQSPSALDVQPLPQEVISIVPKATPVVFASEGGTSAMAPQSPSTPPLLPDPNLEKNILTGIPVQQLRVGMTAIGKISIPMVWANPSTAQTKSGGRSQGEENFVVRLTQPIVNDEGYEVIPPGSEIVCIVQGVHKSGYAIVQATRLVVDKREYVLPKNAIAVTGKGGNPLMASRYGNKGGEIAKRDATAFVFGSLARVGKVLNEPDETSSFASVGIGGSTSTTSIKRRNPNLLGAVLEGGFTPLTEQILARNQAAMREIAEREDVWYVRAGTDVQVVVNQSFEL
jgi:hypothetical protein